MEMDANVDDDQARRLARHVLVTDAWQIVAGTPFGTMIDANSAMIGKKRPALKFFGSYEQCKTIQRGYGGSLYDTVKSYNHRGHWRWDILGDRAIEIAYEILPLLQAGGPLQRRKAGYIILGLGL